MKNSADGLGTVGFHFSGENIREQLKGTKMKSFVQVPTQLSCSYEQDHANSDLYGYGSEH